MTLVFHSIAPNSLHVDNTSAIQILTNHPIFQERTKHIEVDCHYIQDQEAFDDNVITLPQVYIDLQVADIFAKALSRRTKDQLFFPKLLLVDSLTSNERREVFFLGWCWGVM